MFVTSAFAQESAPAVEGAHTGTEGGTHSGTGVPAEAHGTFPPFDPATFPSQLLWLAITFGLFYLFLKKVVMPRVGGIIDVRNDRITQDLDQAARLKGEADARATHAEACDAGADVLCCFCVHLFNSFGSKIPLRFHPALMLATLGPETLAQCPGCRASLRYMQVNTAKT